MPARPEQGYFLGATLKDRAGNVGTAEIEIPGSDEGRSETLAPPTMNSPNPGEQGGFLVPPPPTLSSQQNGPMPQQIPQANAVQPPMTQAMPQQPYSNYTTTAKPARMCLRDHRRPASHRSSTRRSLSRLCPKQTICNQLRIEPPRISRSLRRWSAARQSLCVRYSTLPRKRPRHHLRNASL